MKSKQILFLFSFSILFLFSNGLNAQKMDRSHHGKHKFHAIMEQLDLNEAQLAQIEKINADFKTKRTALHQADNVDKSAIHTLREEQRATVFAILTPAQKEKMETIKAAHKEKKEAHRAEKKAFFEENKSHFKAMKADGKAYAKENIEPVLRQQRAKLEQKMDKEDIAYINGLRKQVKEQKMAMKAERATKEKGVDKPDFKKGKRGHRGHGHHGKHDKGRFLAEADMEKMKALATKYSDEIDRLEAEIAPQKETWKKEMKENAKSHFEEMDIPADKREAWEARKQGKKDCKKDGKDCKKDGKKHAKKRHAHQGHRADHQKIKFLLMNPNQPDGKKGKPTLAQKDLHQTKVYPNPSETFQTLEFTVQKAGKVQIDIVDKQGNIIKTLENKLMPAGKNTVEVNVSDLRGYVFYYRIQDESGASSTKFLVKQ